MGTGYLTRDDCVTPGVPEVGLVSEEVWYACRFWPDHMGDVSSPVSAGLIGALRNFLSTQIVLWIEILASRGEFRNLHRVREWLQVLKFTMFCSLHLLNPFEFDRTHYQRKLPSSILRSTSILASCLDRLSVRLSYMDRREDAFGCDPGSSSRSGGSWWRKQPALFNPDLATSLQKLANCLSKLGRRQKALHAIQQAVKLTARISEGMARKIQSQNLPSALQEPR